MSLRKHLGELSDEWMSAKIELVRNLRGRIMVAKDATEIAALRKELTEALLNEEDVNHLNIVVGKLVETMTTHGTALREFKMRK